MSFNIDDLVMIKDVDGNIISGGYNIDSTLLKEQLNNEMVGGNKLNNYLIPMGLLYKDIPYEEDAIKSNTSEIINDDIYEKLFNMATEVKKNNIKTYKKREKKEKRQKSYKNK
jgi:hypothetical protein